MTDLAARLVSGLRQTEGLALAVSGGGDSMAMLHLAVAAGLRPSVVTVDHGLRPEAAAEAAMVAAVATGLGLPHRTLRWQRWDGRGNLQNEARKARRQLIADWAVEIGLTSVALAHTQDDVAETFLMRLARGAGVDGLAAMATSWVEGGVLWQRPLLTVARADLRRWLEGRGLTWVEDPSNDNVRFDRVKVRKAMAPLSALGLTGGRLAEVARHLAEAQAALDVLADNWSRECLIEEAGTVRLSPALWRAPEETQRRLIRRVILWIAPSDYAPRGAQISHLLAALKGGQAATLAGCRFLADQRAVREARAAAPRTKGMVWDGRWRLSTPLPDGAELGAMGAEGLAQCDWRAAGLPRAALLAAPAVWQGKTLIAAPLLGFGPPELGVVPLQPLQERNSVPLSH